MASPHKNRHHCLVERDTPLSTYAASVDEFWGKSSSAVRRDFNSSPGVKQFSLVCSGTRNQIFLSPPLLFLVASSSSCPAPEGCKRSCLPPSLPRRRPNEQTSSPPIRTSSAGCRYMYSVSRFRTALNQFAANSIGKWRTGQHGECVTLMRRSRRIHTGSTRKTSLHQSL